MIPYDIDEVYEGDLAVYPPEEAQCVDCGDLLNDDEMLLGFCSACRPEYYTRVERVPPGVRRRYRGGC